MLFMITAVVPKKRTFTEGHLHVCKHKSDAGIRLIKYLDQLRNTKRERFNRYPQRPVKWDL